MILSSLSLSLVVSYLFLFLLSYLYVISNKYLNNRITYVLNYRGILYLIQQLYKVQTCPEVKAEIRAMLEAKNPETGKYNLQPEDALTGKPDDVEGNEDSVPSDKP